MKQSHLHSELPCLLIYIVSSLDNIINLDVIKPLKISTTAGMWYM